ncbi:MAG: hypothetical protein KAW17_09545 [Candidatus Eisenbacteria sp.]|nr:hypothetical protein [Candidatus Eisenbacteria bacterium]
MKTPQEINEIEDRADNLRDALGLDVDVETFERQRDIRALIATIRSLAAEARGLLLEPFDSTTDDWVNWLDLVRRLQSYALGEKVVPKDD